MNCFLKLFKKQAPEPAKVIPIRPDNPPVLRVEKTKLLGIDVSHYEPSVDWDEAKAFGVDFMFTKATEGLFFIDKLLQKHITDAKRAGVLTGVYHFFHASNDGAAQAEHFLKVIHGLDIDLPLVLDWEQASADNLPANIQKTRAQIFLDEVEQASAKKPIIYGGSSFLKELILENHFKQYPLWLAHYGVTENKVRVPKPWDKFDFWQYTDSGYVDGLRPGHHVDCNFFNGTIEELKALGKKA